MKDIHSTAIVSEQAVIGEGVKIGAFTIVHDDVVIGDNTIIDSHCEIGYPTPLAEGALLNIGPNSLIRSHSVFYAGSRFGERLTNGHRVTVRELTDAGKNFQLGTLGDIQGHCTIGDHVRTHSGVFISHGTKIGNFVWIFPHVAFANDPHPPSDVCLGAEVSDYAAIATMSVILPGVKIGEHSLVAANSCVGKDVEAHTVVGGTPAKFLFGTSRIKLRDGSDQPAYPWPRHFHRGYPEDLVEAWRAKYA